MAFNSLYFALFLLVAALLFYATKKAIVQRWILVIASIVFVSFFSLFSALALILISALNFFLLRRLSNTSSPKSRKNVYLGSIVFNVLLLAGYKLLQEVLTTSGIKLVQGFDNSKWIILGMGFYTLQVIGYLFEVYKRRAKFDLPFIEFFLSLAFFSKLPSGPILKLNEAKSFLNAGAVSFQEENFSYGIQRFLLGLFKKIALADRLLPFVKAAFDDNYGVNGLTFYLAPFLFTLQLYFDFSGYIDMALGSARIFGIRLPENFNLPLRARSISEFWRRWHISLVNWLTIYIFYPISYRYRKLKGRGIAIAVVCTFLVSALWHGFALTFFIWAACHFTYIILENVFGRKEKKQQTLVVQFLQIIVVWHLVSFSNIFFRSATVTDAYHLLLNIKSQPFLYGQGLTFKGWLINGGQDIENEFNYRFAIVLALLFLVFEKKLNQYAQSEKYNLIYVSLTLVAIVVLGMFNAGERFIYLQF